MNVPQQPTYNNGIESSPHSGDNNESQRTEAERRQREWEAEETRAVEHEQKIFPYVIVILVAAFLVIVAGALEYPKSGIRSGAIIAITGASVFALLTYLRGNY
jgi:hypothetical protein